MVNEAERLEWVIGLGASAGGLESLQRFFDGVTSLAGCAFVVVQHLSPNHETMMDRLIGRHTHMPVSIAEDGQELRPGNVYVMPPKKDMEVDGKCIRLFDQDRSELPQLPIDRFMRSLAQSWSDHSAAIILSGSGSDGARGIRDVHQAGGFVLVESQSTAKFSGMPNAAMATGITEGSYPPESMGEELLTLLSDLPRKEEDDNIVSDKLEEILSLLRAHCRTDFHHYKISTLSRRIDRRVGLNSLATVDDYIQYLQTHPAEVDLLYQDLLIGVTRFFRDSACFQQLETTALRPLVRNAVASRPIRIWVAGCATGEEAYTLAILLEEVSRKLKASIDYKIFATDIHPGSLRTAARGVYSSEALRGFSDALRERYFVEDDGQFAAVKAIRSRIVFAPHNVIQDPPFTNLDLVTCRNLLIYLDAFGQRKALTSFHYGLREDGYLFLGPSETIGNLGSQFNTVDERCKIFSKCQDTFFPRELRISDATAARAALHRRGEALQQTENVGRMRNYDRLIDQLMPPTILVDGNRQILETFGGTERLLSVPRRSFNRDVLNFVPEVMQNVLASLLRASAREKAIVTGSVANVDFEGLNYDVRLTVQPLKGRQQESDLFAIQIERDGRDLDLAAESLDAKEIVEDASMQPERFRMLEAELDQTREDLQSTIEELESSNEELQATNEELIASNEELQSTNEELNSVNEELHTVNVEYQNQNSELRQLYEDLNHLLASTDIATVFLDSELKIRRFTPAVADIFDLKPTDIGRPLATFAHTLRLEDLGGLLSGVLDDEEIVEQEVSDQDNRHFYLRVLPYQFDGSRNGVVLTLTDLTGLVEARKLAQQYQQKLQASIDAIPILVSYINSDEVYEYANRAYEKWLHKERETIVGRSIRDVLGEETYLLSKPHIDAALAGEVQLFENLVHSSTGELLTLNVSYIPDYDDEGRVAGFFVSGSDVSVAKRAKRELAKALETAQKANQAKSDFLARMSHEIRSPMTAILSFSDILEEQLSNPDNRNSVEVIRRNGQHLLSIINDILDLSRIESGKFELSPSDFDLISLLKECHNTVLPLAEAANVKLSAELPNAESLWFFGDGRRLTQIIVNLMSNAIKFSGDGEVTLLAEIIHGQVQISVADTGCGIPEDFQSKVFEPFCQAEGANNRRFEGTGLGLAICKQLVDQMDGEISVESEVGEGTCFTVNLPLRPGTPDGDSEKTLELHSQMGRLDGRRVLVIDDRRDMRFIAEHILSEAGAVVKTADSGINGIDAAASSRTIGEPFDIVVTDIQMPGMDGYETASELRRQGFEIPIVALSASAMQEDRQKAIDAGCTAHCAKPIQRDEFLSLLVKLMQNN